MQNLNKINWYYLINRPRCPLINSLMFTGLINKYETKIPVDYSEDNISIVNGVWYGDKDRDNEILSDIDKVLDKDPEFLYKIAQKEYKKWGVFKKEIQQYSKIDFSELTNKELKDYFSKISKFLLFWNSINLWFMWLPERVLEKRVKNIIEKRVKGNYAKDIFLLLTTSSKKGFFEKEKAKLVKTALKIKKRKFSLNGQKAKKMIDKHLEEFAWMGNPDFKSTFWKEINIKERVKELIDSNSIKELENLTIEKEDYNKKINELFKDLKLSQFERSIIKTARETVYFRTFRTDIQWMVGYYANKLFKEISSRMKIIFEDFHHFFYNEIETFLEKGELNKDIIIKRKSGYAVIILNKRVVVYYDKEKIKKLRYFFEKKEKTSTVDIIKGSIANPGIIKGIVKIINDVKDIKKVMRGDILVATMTKPKYVPAMEKAVGFITDEGGILCHAAIISREMKKPCIIGTKIATKALKDGDEVEVDAERGIVKILKRK